MPWAQILDWLHDTGSCVFCGESASKTSRRTAATRKPMDNPGLPVCRECSGFGRPVAHESLAARRDYIQTIRASRYSNVLKAPEWSKEELSEIGPSMRSSFKAYTAAGKLIKAQLSWCVIPD